MKLAQFVFIIPFISFFIGFGLISLFVHEKSIKTPSLLGHSVLYALRQATQQGFVVKILSEKEATEAQPGTILAQKPVPGAAIKPKQTVFITVAQEPIPLALPELVGKRDGQWQEQVADAGLTVKTVYICHNAPMGMVIAQSPEAGSVSGQQKIYLTISSGPETKRIMPQLYSQPYEQAKEFLESYGIEVSLYSEPYNAKRHAGIEPGAIIAQKPLAGSWIDLKKPLQVQLVVVN
jgi:beta-lactam-binding protein with PASTA domain